MSAKATPIEALPPFVSPLPVVVAEAVSSPFASTLPVRTRPGPAPIVAATVTFEIATATAGATATFALSAPVSASVVIACAPEAWRMRSSPPVRTAVVSIEAVVVSVTRFSAIEAPTPTFDPVAVPSSAGIAETVDSAAETAWIVTSPEPAFTVVAAWPGGPRAGSERIDAVVVRLARLSANEPATPISPPPPPETAVASKRCCAGEPPGVITASSVTPFDVVLAP